MENDPPVVTIETARNGHRYGRACRVFVVEPALGLSTSVHFRCEDWQERARLGRLRMPQGGARVPVRDKLAIDNSRYPSIIYSGIHLIFIQLATDIHLRTT